jgi:2-polyprenyl-3-methyl-5-hydroxy-6-metoxy-1,4-benzoquinol methylase
MSSLFRRREQCALCAASGAALQEVMSLAATPPANEFVLRAECARVQERIPLTLLLCATCGHVQLAEIVDPQRLFGHYVYVSGTSPVFVEHFRKYAAASVARFGLGGSSFVVDIGSNDGTLLKQFQQQHVGSVLGVDPASEIATTATAQGIPTLCGFFTSALADEIKASHGSADLITANNVFAHAEDLEGFARSAAKLLSPEGVFVFEVSYLVDVVEKLLFDTIYHEHLSYHAVLPLVRFFERIGLRLFDAQRIDTHGGSVRGFVCKPTAQHENTAHLASLIRKEEALGLFTPATYAAFKQRISQRGEQVKRRITEVRAAGGRVAGYGAPAKLTTLMHEFGLTDCGIEFIIDDSPLKLGHCTPGSHIPVEASAALYERQPDLCVVFAWNFADSIVKKHAAYTANGGRFLIPLPEVLEL